MLILLNLLINNRYAKLWTLIGGKREPKSIRLPTGDCMSVGDPREEARFILKAMISAGEMKIKVLRTILCHHK
jgi:hypothetical protein